MANNVNPKNYVVLEGRTVSQPVIKTNKDGSRKVLMTLAVQNNYLSDAHDGSGGKVKDSQCIGVQGFLPKTKKTNGVYACIDTGDLIRVICEVHRNNYQKDGEMIYSQVLMVQDVELKETKAQKAARQARKAAEKAALAAKAPGAAEAACPAGEMEID